MRLDKYLAETAQCTRSEAKTLLSRGRVTVNGAVCKKGDTQLREGDSVAVDGAPLAYQQFVYLMLNKPEGVVSASTDKRDTTVVDLIGDAYPRQKIYISIKKFPHRKPDVKLSICTPQRLYSYLPDTLCRTIEFQKQKLGSSIPQKQLVFHIHNRLLKGKCKLIATSLPNGNHRTSLPRRRYKIRCHNIGNGPP